MVVLSDLLGIASIGCWLGAQFPQVIENIRRQSCEGLALPFLANWLLGDISNLVGCILTHQLPFQTWLATYFVIVDCLLVVQYFYYRKPPAKSISHFGHSARSATTPGGRRLSVERGTSRYRTLSTVAANVAAAAAFAAQKEEEQQPPTSSRSLRPYPTYGADDTHPGLSSAEAEEEREEEGDAMGESFYSEGGRSASRRKRLAWSVERSGRARSVGRYPPPRPTTPTALFNLSTPEIPPREPPTIQTSEVDEEEHDLNASIARRSSRASRRGATMVFLSTWALFGIGSIAGPGGAPSSTSSSVGRLLFPQQSAVPVVVFPEVDSPLVDLNLVPKAADAYKEDADFASVELQKSHDQSDNERDPTTPHLPLPEEPDSQRVLGRIFAWLCTMLYLTSRLPQIWKNFVRKSVEGLSMYLFVFAFLGNTFYVASILLSPKTLLPPPQAAEFIRESIPYLLGSAGTLMFDLTIVTQSFIYRPRQKRHATPRTQEEEAGLLASDDIEEHPPLSSGEATFMNRGRVGRTRSVG